MKHYETIFISNPNLGDEEYGGILTNFRDSIEKSKGVIIKTEEWGKQKLAYQLKKFDNGFYVLMEYCGEPGITAELERRLKLDERVLKYQTVKLADNADPEALIQKEKETKEKDRLKTAEAPEKEMSEEIPKEGTPEEGPLEVAETGESESKQEGAENDAEAPVMRGEEAQKEEKKEGPQESKEVEDTTSQNEGEIED
jgi:small subunit ribosomal protein S6